MTKNVPHQKVEIPDPASDDPKWAERERGERYTTRRAKMVKVKWKQKTCFKIAVNEQIMLAYAGR